MSPLPFWPLPVAAFVLGDPVASGTSLFTPIVVALLALECCSFVCGGFMLWLVARPLRRPTRFHSKTARRRMPVSTALKFNSPSLRPIPRREVRSAMLLPKQTARAAVLRAADRVPRERGSVAKSR